MTTLGKLETAGQVLNGGGGGGGSSCGEKFFLWNADHP